VSNSDCCKTSKGNRAVTGSRRKKSAGEKKNKGDSQRRGSVGAFHAQNNHCKQRKGRETWGT